MARHPRRQGPRHRRHLPQHAPGRRVGVGRRCRVSGAVRVHGVSSRHRLRDVQHDPLIRTPAPVRASAVVFKFLFKYPLSTFSRGHFALLGTWPTWMLWLSIAVVSGVLALVIIHRRAKLPPRDCGSRNLRSTGIWLLQSMLAAVLLLFLWQPAITLTELKPQQDIIVFLVDDSRSMTLAENGTTRQAQAIAALRGGLLTGVEKRFQTRLYRFDSQLTRIADLKELRATAPATRIGDSLKQLAQETEDLPVGAIVLLTHGADNAGGIDAETIAALRSRHIPVHTVGFGADHASHDVEIDDAVMAPRAMADSRLAAGVRFHQHGYRRH